MMKSIRITRTATLGLTATATGCILVLGGPSIALAGIAFTYDPIEDPILSASFSVDFAAMNAHRYLVGHEMNYAQLVDCNPGGGLPDYDLSDDLFGTASWPNEPQVNLGVLETGWITAGIDSSFFTALAGGKVGLRALFTDTADGMFAMDFISLTIVTGTETVESYYGWPMGNENNGFGIGIPDSGDLPAPLPGPIPVGATGTGFDETISSKSILGIPEPATIALLVLGAVIVVTRRGQ